MEPDVPLRVTVRDARESGQGIVLQWFVAGAIRASQGLEQGEVPHGLALRCGKGGCEPALPLVGVGALRLSERHMRHEAPPASGRGWQEPVQGRADPVLQLRQRGIGGEANP